jgi:hypothetical protein
MKPTRAGTKFKTQDRLARHAELMAGLEAQGMPRNKASAEALRQLENPEEVTRCPDCGAKTTDDGYSIDERACFYCQP